MSKYQVIIPWHGVSKGQILTIKEPHEALKPNLLKLGAEPVLEVATPSAKREHTPSRGKQQDKK